MKNGLIVGLIKKMLYNHYIKMSKYFLDLMIALVEMLKLS